MTGVGPTFLITRRELGTYLRSMTGYVIAAILLLVDGLLFNIFAIGGDDKLSAVVLAQFFFYTSGLTMIASVFISMRLVAEERQTGTLVLLTSSPVMDGQIIVGKFLSGFLFLAMVLGLSIFMPLLILVNGKISVGHLVAGYLGLLLLGSASMAIGTLGSALARTQVLAAIFSGCFITAMVLAWMLVRVTERPFNDVFAALAIHGKHFLPFQMGAIHLRDVVYYLMVTLVALFAAVRVMEARRWR
jgi:ABC-2 type transport system permease protein